MSGSTGAASDCPPAPAQAGQSAASRLAHWRLVSRLDLGPLPTAVPCARLHVRHIVKEWNLAHLAGDAELIVSELMTNALNAAGPLTDVPPIGLHLLASQEHLMIQVWDSFSALPAPKPHTIDAETGRGLEIVSLLSDRWGCYHAAGGGKVVWATLRITVAPRATQEAGQ